ncbi:hypothetical protein PR003_g1566 [Phytophthora rubi]|uniref:Secreted protein n=1 Tax=Phytophthora rubi TaxID=129364 RepID=A0A6A3NDM6_9STRA|nr:hypothetical protein PR002_g10709 [Phytophthora rubi]KAE9043495.1 hypothetical protein PR001_g5773 [Phytophthora rubi]KAE9357890.1 hypothetical protein PR003_g1566 [Phytophthora rubi]
MTRRADWTLLTALVNMPLSVELCCSVCTSRQLALLRTACLTKWCTARLHGSTSLVLATCRPRDNTS